VKLSFDMNNHTYSVDLVPSGRSYRATIAEQSLDVEEIQAADGKLDLLVDGKRITAYVSSDGARRWVTVNGQTLVLVKSTGARSRGHGQHHAAGELTAPMPGQVRAVHINEGDTVAKGQTLMLLEAMKMEIRIQSPQDGVVKKLFIQQGQTVEREQMLVEISEAL
jgi:3-methylcrotonyl-CoA carboxylase alpha subunit